MFARTTRLGTRALGPSARLLPPRHPAPGARRALPPARLLATKPEPEPDALQLPPPERARGPKPDDDTPPRASTSLDAALSAVFGLGVGAPPRPRPLHGLDALQSF